MDRDIFVARQPIYDRYMNVFAYELLYRDGLENKYSGKNGDVATSNVIADMFFSFGIDKLLDNKKAFINFTPKLLENGIPLEISNEILVIEILENIKPSDEIIEAIKDMKSKGYKIALDDFIIENIYDDLIVFADIIKIDYVGTTRIERKKIIDKYSKNSIKFLAEKIETYAEFKEAINMGFDYFQGYFFSKPIILQTKDINEITSNYINIIEELEKEDPSYEVITDVLKRDLSLTFKLLKLVNSPAFYRREKITSIHGALVYLGFKEIKKWLSILMIREIGGGYNEMVKTSLVRARVAESISENINCKSRKSELFILGLFSLIDKITGNKLEDIMGSLPIEEDLKQGILGRNNTFGRVLKTINSYERGEWDKYEVFVKSINIETWIVPDYYYKAVQWVNDLEKEGDRDE